MVNNFLNLSGLFITKKGFFFFLRRKKNIQNCIFHSFTFRENNRIIESINEGGRPAAPFPHSSPVLFYPSRVFYFKIKKCSFVKALIFYLYGFKIQSTIKDFFVEEKYFGFKYDMMLFPSPPLHVQLSVNLLFSAYRADF